MKTHTNARAQAGFTLYELLITVFIVGIMLSFGISNIGEFNRNGRMTAAANDLHASFYLARSEAARAKQNVSICGTANPMAANPVCGAAFTQGWVVFVDTNGNVQVDAGDTVIRRHPARDATISIDTPGMDDYFAFAPTGLGRGSVLANPPVTTAVICDGRGNVVAAGGSSSARVLVITPLGRATVLRDVGQVQTIINNSGAACP